MSHAFTYQAPYGTFHFSEGLLTVELAEDLIVDLPLMQRVAAQRLELLGDREVAELIVIPRAHLLLDRAALTWMAQVSSLSGCTTVPSGCRHTCSYGGTASIR